MDTPPLLFQLCLSLPRMLKINLTKMSGADWAAFFYSISKAIVCNVACDISTLLFLLSEKYNIFVWIILVISFLVYLFSKTSPQQFEWFSVKMFLLHSPNIWYFFSNFQSTVLLRRSVVLKASTYVIVVKCEKKEKNYSPRPNFSVKQAQRD